MKIKNLALMAGTGLGLLASGSQAFAEEHWRGNCDRHEYREDHHWRDWDRHDHGHWRDHDRHNYSYGGTYGYSSPYYYETPYYASPYYEAPVAPPPVVVRPYRPGFGVYFGVR